MNKITIPKWSACITIGMQKGYTNEKIEYDEIKNHLKDIQEIQIKRDQLYLSANVFQSDILLFGHQEPHINLNFINYPRFPASEEKLKNGVLEIAAYLQIKLQQNRVLIVFDNEITMLEESSELDKGINLVQ
jgi:hypothetical protein